MTGFKQLVNLVKRFTSSPSSPYRPQDIAITFGETRISYVIQPSNITRTGHVDRGIYAKLMLDAATLAAGTLAEEQDVLNDSFSMYSPVDVQSSRLTAVARLTHSDNGRYTVETRLLDENRTPVASGYGLFSVSEAPIEPVSEDTEEIEPAPDRPVHIAYGAMWKSPVGLIHLN